MEGESPTLTVQSMAEKTPHIPGLVQLIPDNEGESNTGRIQDGNYKRGGVLTLHRVWEEGDVNPSPCGIFTATEYLWNFNETFPHGTKTHQ